MARATVDDSAWPLVVAVTPGEMSSEEYADYLARLGALLDREKRFALLVDSRRLLAISARDRQRTAEFLRAAAPRANRYFVAAAVVLATSLQRGILRAVLWVYSLPQPVRVFATAEEARAWLREKLAEEGRAAKGDAVRAGGSAGRP